jgi:hypothetical protein
MHIGCLHTHLVEFGNDLCGGGLSIAMNSGDLKFEFDAELAEGGLDENPWLNHIEIGLHSNCENTWETKCLCVIEIKLKLLIILHSIILALD